MPVKPLDRRTFLQGFGVSLSLPWLEAMLPINKSWAAPPSRFATLYAGNGLLTGINNTAENDYWSSVGSATGISTFSAPMQQLAAYKNYLTIVQNCSFGNIQDSGDAGHEQAAPSFLTGQNIANDSNVKPPQATSANVSRLAGAGQSIDRMIASRQTTSLKSLMMAVATASGSYYNTYAHAQVMANLSWDSQTQHLTNETIRTSAEVFARLTSSGLNNATGAPTTPTDGATLLFNQKKSVIDAVLTDVNSLISRLGNADKQVMNQYLDSLRKVEMDLQGALPPVTPPTMGGTCVLPSAATLAEYKADTASAYNHITKTSRNMIEMMALAFQCGITNVSTLMLSYDWSTVPGAQLMAAYGANNVNSDSYHNASHYNTDGVVNGGIAAVQAVNYWHATQLAYLAQVFLNTKEADGSSLLDNSLILFGAGMGDPAQHSFSRMIRVLLGRGAGLKPGTNGKIIDAGGGGNAHPKLLQSILTGFGIGTTIGESGGASIANVTS